jgi:hypothetical protein
MRAICLAVLAAALAAGCSSPLRFPEAPLFIETSSSQAMCVYDTNGDGRPDYFTTQNTEGRTVRIAYGATGSDQPGDTVDLDALTLADCRHIVIILDGFGYDTVAEFQKEGHLRLFYPPRRVISTFPPMTDLALADVFRTVHGIGYEVILYNHRTERLQGGDRDYASLINEAWVHDIDFRANPVIDAICYLFPKSAFNLELGNFLKLFDLRDRMELRAYFVSTAGASTHDGLDGQRRVLRQVDQLCEELVWKTRGLVKITILSDHGHTLTPSRRVDFGKYLSGLGWHMTDHLTGPRDVADVEYGLISYAGFATRDRPGLAADLVKHPATDLVTYPETGAVVVQTTDGLARVERQATRYRYRAEKGDPLGLAPVIEKMRADGVIDKNGWAEDAEWFRRTVTHQYPDPLDRLWRAFNGLVENPPDLVVSLRPEFNNGPPSRAFFLPVVASTHGSLERRDSTAFIMSTAGPMDEAGEGVRSRQVAPLFEKLEGHSWPARVKGEGK